MKKYTCIILDDEPKAVQLLRTYTGNTGALDLIHAGTSCKAVKEILSKQKIDIIFLDIQMPEINGMDIMKQFNNNNRFILTTAYPQYALEGYEYNVIDYLLKPISYERFLQSVQKLIAWKEKQASVEDLLFIKESGISYQINTADILFIEGMRDYIKIKTAARQYLVLDNLKDILNRLPVEQFIRVHKSYIINKARIKSVDTDTILIEQEAIPIGNTYKKVLEMILK